MAQKLTPLDIQQKVFTRKKLGGLDETEVTGFLREVAREYEQLYSDGKGLRDQLTACKLQMKDYQEMERTLKQTLIDAQRASHDRMANAEKEAELIRSRAELEAERVVESARQEVTGLTDEVRQLKKAKRKLRIELKNVLDSFYDMLRDEIGPDPDERRPASHAPGASL
jgi:cell division initiation protein